MIFSAGFSEMSEAGQRAQDELTRIARDSGVRNAGLDPDNLETSI